MTPANDTDPLPKYTWWALGLTAVLLLALTVIAIGLISAGILDPKPVGELTAEYPLETLSIAGQTQKIIWLDELPAADFSLRLTAAYDSGELDSGYGFVVGSNEGGLAALVSPLGYTAVVNMIPQFPQAIGDETTVDELDNMILNGPAPEGSSPEVVWTLVDTADSGNYLTPWQTWPHVKHNQETNEIWLDKQGETITIRINRELLMNGRLPTTPLSHVGLWLGSFNSPTTIAFQTLQIYTE